MAHAVLPVQAVNACKLQQQTAVQTAVQTEFN